MALATHELFKIKAVPKQDYQASSDSYLDYFKIAIGETTVFLGKINPENKWELTQATINARFNLIN